MGGYIYPSMDPKGQKLIGVIFDQAAVFSMNQLVNCSYIFKAGLYYQLKILVWKNFFEKFSLSINFFFKSVESCFFSLRHKGCKFEIAMYKTDCQWTIINYFCIWDTFARMTCLILYDFKGISKDKEIKFKVHTTYIKKSCWKK